MSVDLKSLSTSSDNRGNENNISLVNFNPCSSLSEENRKTWQSIEGAKGAFGSVFRIPARLSEVEGNGEEEVTAVKEICFERTLTKYKGWISIPILFREVENWKKINHKNVVSYHCSNICGPNANEILNNTYQPPDLTSTSPIEEINFLHIHMEYCDITLAQYLLNEDIPRLPIIDICIQLLSGLVAIHKCGIIHRDLSNTNIFLKGHVWKIGDFGLSKQSLDDEENSAHKGTLPFQSPEMCAGSKTYTGLTDVYSLALNFLLLLNPQLSNIFLRNGIFLELREGDSPESALTEAKKGISPEHSVEASIVSEMLQRNVSVRLSAEKALYKFKDHSEDALKHLTLKLRWSDNKSHHAIKKCCNGFVSCRQMEISKINNFFDTKMREKNDSLNFISINGECSVGKSELARKIGMEFYENRGSCIWIDCEDIASNYKRFCELSPGVTSPWLIIFDGIDASSIGYFNSIIKAFEESQMKPNFVIVTSTSKIGNLSSGCEIKLDFTWINTLISERRANLGTLMSLIVKSDIQSSNTSPETFHLITRIYETCGLIEKPSVSDVEILFGLFALIAYLFRTTDRLNKIGFILFWKRFVKQTNINNVLKVFQSSGILSIVGPPSEDSANKASAVWQFFLNVKSFLNNKEIESSKEDEHKYVITLSSKICSEIILPHPMVRYIFENVLKQDPSEAGILKRMLQTFREFGPEENHIIYNIRTIFSMRFYSDILKYDSLCQEFPSEITAFAKCGTTEENKMAYEKFTKLFGDLDENALTIGIELSKDYERTYSLEGVQLLTDIYEKCKLVHGESGAKSQFAGERLAEHLERLHEIDLLVKIRKEIAFNCERDLGTKTSNIHLYKLAKLLNKTGQKTEALEIYQKILPRFDYDYFTEESIKDAITELKEALNLT